MKIADLDDGTTRPSSQSPSAVDVDLEAENRELRKGAKQLEQANEILRRATAYFARRRPRKMMFPRKGEVPPPLVRDLAADAIPGPGDLSGA